MTLVLIGSLPGVVFPVMQAARALGASRCIVLGTRETMHLRWSSLCHRMVVADLQDVQGARMQLRGLAHEFPEATLVPCDCHGIRLVQALKDQVGLATTLIPDCETLEWLDDKWRFHGLCLEQGLPVPPTVHRMSKSELRFEELAAALGLPFIVKPSNCSGSFGVVVVRSKSDLDVEILGNRHYHSGPLVAQRFIDGWDIDVDLVAVAGTLTAVTTRRVDGCWMEHSRHATLENMAARLCRSTSFSGPMNIDARIDRATGQLYLIESNPRFWASLTAPAACGLNFLQESLPGFRPDRTEPRRPTSSRCNRRHPLLRPSEWWKLLFDSGHEGKLLRIAMFDPYTLAGLAAEIPAMAGRRVRKAGTGLSRKLAKGLNRASSG